MAVSDVPVNIPVRLRLRLRSCPSSILDQVPRVVQLLSESYNPHLRCGAALALGIACAGTGFQVRRLSGLYLRAS